MRTYRIYCYTEDKWVSGESVDPLTECPNNSGHSVDSNSVVSTDIYLDDNVHQFLDENATVEVPITDSTSVIGPFHLMQTLINRRELFNDTESPIYDPSMTPILGEDGYLVDHANRINNLETIHGKLGWHNQQIVENTYIRPRDLLIYYGWLNGFNYAVNGWSNELVAQDMSKYGLLVFGNGLQDPGHGDYSNTQVIIPRIKELNPRTLIFGYVSVNQTLANFQTKVDQWDTLGVHGIFFDEAGYNYGSTATNGRAAFNAKIDYVHDSTAANLCFVNSWNMDHIIGTADDGSYPNTTWNPDLLESTMSSNDWALLESFPINSSAYAQDYESASEWLSRGTTAIGHRQTYGINLASIGVIEETLDSSTKEALFNFGFTSALMWAFESYGSSDIYYGSGSSTVSYQTRPNLSDLPAMKRIYSLYPSIQQDNTDSSVYHRFVDHGKLSVDFSSSAQTYSITPY